MADFLQMWLYNQAAFNFDKKMQQAAITQKTAERKEWVQLYREDINNLWHMTVKRMDIFITLNSLEMLALIALVPTPVVHETFRWLNSSYYDLPADENTKRGILLSPPVFMNQQSTSESLLIIYVLAFVMPSAFLLFSTWLAIEASILAQVCGLSMQMQCKQLRALPTGVDVDRGRARGQDFEETDKELQLRIPFVRRISRFVRSTFGGGAGGNDHINGGRSSRRTTRPGLGRETTTGVFGSTGEDHDDANGVEQLHGSSSGNDDAAQEADLYNYEPDPIDEYLLNENMERELRKRYLGLTSLRDEEYEKFAANRIKYQLPDFAADDNDIHVGGISSNYQDQPDEAGFSSESDDQNGENSGARVIHADSEEEDLDLVGRTHSSRRRTRNTNAFAVPERNVEFIEREKINRRRRRQLNPQSKAVQNPRPPVPTLASDSANPPGSKLICMKRGHLRTYRILQQHFLYYDVYARIASCFGFLIFLHFIGFFLTTDIVLFESHPAIGLVIALLIGFASAWSSSMDFHYGSVVRQFCFKSCQILMMFSYWMTMLLKVCNSSAQKNGFTGNNPLLNSYTLSLLHLIFTPLPALFQFIFVMQFFFLSQPTTRNETGRRDGGDKEHEERILSDAEQKYVLKLPYNYRMTAFVDILAYGNVLSDQDLVPVDSEKVVDAEGRRKAACVADVGGVGVNSSSQIDVHPTNRNGKAVTFLQDSNVVEGDRNLPPSGIREIEMTDFAAVGGGAARNHPAAVGKDEEEEHNVDFSTLLQDEDSSKNQDGVVLLEKCLKQQIQLYCDLLAWLRVIYNPPKLQRHGANETRNDKSRAANSKKSLNYGRESSTSSTTSSDTKLSRRFARHGTTTQHSTAPLTSFFLDSYDETLRNSEPGFVLRNDKKNAEKNSEEDQEEPDREDEVQDQTDSTTSTANHSGSEEIEISPSSHLSDGGFENYCAQQIRDYEKNNALLTPEEEEVEKERKEEQENRFLLENCKWKILSLIDKIRGLRRRSALTGVGQEVLEQQSLRVPVAPAGENREDGNEANANQDVVQKPLALLVDEQYFEAEIAKATAENSSGSTSTSSKPYWIEKEYYDPNTGTPLYFYVCSNEGEKIRYSIPSGTSTSEAGLIRQDFFPNQVEVLVSNLLNLEKEIDAAEVVVVDDKELHDGKNAEHQEELQGSTTRSQPAKGTTAARPCVVLGCKFVRKVKHPFASWWTRKVARYETPNITGEIQTLERSAIAAGKLPLHMYNILVGVYLLCLLLAFVLQVFQSAMVFSEMEVDNSVKPVLVNENWKNAWGAVVEQGGEAAVAAPDDHQTSSFAQLQDRSWSEEDRSTFIGRSSTMSGSGSRFIVEQSAEAGTGRSSTRTFQGHNFDNASLFDIHIDSSMVERFAASSAGTVAPSTPLLSTSQFPLTSKVTQMGCSKSPSFSQPQRLFAIATDFEVVSNTKCDNSMRKHSFYAQSQKKIVSRIGGLGFRKEERLIVDETGNSGDVSAPATRNEEVVFLSTLHDQGRKISECNVETGVVETNYEIKGTLENSTPLRAASMYLFQDEFFLITSTEKNNGNNGPSIYLMGIKDKEEDKTPTTSDSTEADLQLHDEVKTRRSSSTTTMPQQKILVPLLELFPKFSLYLRQHVAYPYAGDLSGAVPMGESQQPPTRDAKTKQKRQEFFHQFAIANFWIVKKTPEVLETQLRAYGGGKGKNKAMKNLADLDAIVDPQNPEFWKKYVIQGLLETGSLFEYDHFSEKFNLIYQTTPLLTACEISETRIRATMAGEAFFEYEKKDLGLQF
ncbi:unnamed protein product [Amoebophrya sp. A120]|nr:unnamed protein product [Amoebophrya sp. A120]|eukprot:GSA120T00008638001.1